MASHLAAQDYLARLQASGLNFPQMGDPYSALSALSGASMNVAPKNKQPQKSERWVIRCYKSIKIQTSLISDIKDFWIFV